MSSSNSSDGEMSFEDLLVRKAYAEPLEFDNTVYICASIWRTALAHAHILNKDVDDTLLKKICEHFLNLPQKSLENGISKDMLRMFRVDPESLFDRVKEYHTDKSESDSTDASKDSDGSGDSKDSDGSDDSKDSDGTDDSKDSAGNDSKGNAGTDDSPAAKEEAIPPLPKFI